MKVRYSRAEDFVSKLFQNSQHQTGSTDRQGHQKVAISGAEQGDRPARSGPSGRAHHYTHHRSGERESSDTLTYTDSLQTSVSSTL